MMGAAWATLASYAVMATLGAVISQRLYPIPFERGRLLLLATGAAAVFVLGRLAPAALWPAIAWKTPLVAAYAAAAALGVRRPRREDREA
jgi:hypothetical protein